MDYLKGKYISMLINTPTIHFLSIQLMHNVLQCINLEYAKLSSPFIAYLCVVNISSIFYFSLRVFYLYLDYVALLSEITYLDNKWQKKPLDTYVN